MLIAAMRLRLKTTAFMVTQNAMLPPSQVRSETMGGAGCRGLAPKKHFAIGTLLA
jgi:hypothetical protein